MHHNIIPALLAKNNLYFLSELPPFLAPAFLAPAPAFATENPTEKSKRH
jgi:hypothetical protein